MKNQQSKKVKEDLLLRLFDETEDMAKKVLSSKQVRELLKHIKALQKKSKSDLKYILREKLEKDLRCEDDLVLLDKMYRTNGNREILCTKIAKEIKEMDFLKIGFKESIMRKVICAVIQLHYHDMHKENVSKKIMTVIRFQYACSLLWLLCEFGKYMDMEVKSGCEGKHLDDLFLGLHRIGRLVGSLEFVDTLDHTRLLEIMMQEERNKSR